MKKKPKAICILGMHRSGTSTVSRCLNLLGVDLGNKKNLTGSGKANPKGFWEFTQITRTQQKILKILFTSWDRTEPLEENWMKNFRVKNQVKKLKEVVRANFGNSKLWGWKDPRTCLLLPIWERTTRELNMDTSYVIVVRNPLDVAASLAKRNGFLLEKSLRIWALYTLSAFLYTENKERTMITYESLLENWEVPLKNVSTDLSIPWRGDISDSIKEFLSPSLQHNKSSIEDLKQKTTEFPHIFKLYQLIIRAEKDKEFFNSAEFSNNLHELYFQLYGKYFNNDGVK
ncbi:sulfotransferase family protein [Pseudalkalibacillus caeni]|uniref:Uncharacterized protein n=1 Tax=Exobacillus caeni TaxID=2574798 RepID=A0A5R9FB97_9BACL|nr:sulfotransferase domain-containing protein [Pseudalkalibacillus caeni]TLS36895.1 hypothetical protein FCL54_13140 [Pseudalkalibacillus caeni]